MARVREVYNGKTGLKTEIPFTVEEEAEMDSLQAQDVIDKQNRADAETKRETDKVNANQKLKDLGLTDDEIKAIKGIS